MLQSETAFPQAGSRAFVKPEGVQVRIIQRNANGTLKITGKSRDGRSIDRTVSLDDLVPLGVHHRGTAATGACAQIRRGH